MTVDEREVGRYWNENAPAWTDLSRQGFDAYRDWLNTPAFMAMLPPVEGLCGLDIGCGEGHNTRLITEHGARMAAIDIAEAFIARATDREGRRQQGIDFLQASGTRLPFAAASFQFAVATMSLMDLPDPAAVLAETYRVLKPGAFLQFSISHPCFFSNRWQWVLDDEGRRQGLASIGYFDETEEAAIDEWCFSAAPPEVRADCRPFRIPRFHRTLSGWLNLLVDRGFVLERFQEPHASDAIAKDCPHVADTRLAAYFLHVRCRKPQGSAA